MKDLLIIGAGPAGLSAAIYGKRAGLDLSVLEKFAPGGQVLNTYEVENYPGFTEPVSGFELMQNMESQAVRFGTEIVNAEISSVKKDADGFFTVSGTNSDLYRARAVILAMGSSYKKLNVPGESEFTGKGVSYCATCDGAFYRDRVTAVVGGGNTSLEEALFLTRFASKVYLIHRRDTYRADAILTNRILSNPKIEPIHSSVIETINGDGKVSSITIKNVLNNSTRDLSLDGVFIFVGYEPNTKAAPKELLDSMNQIETDIGMQTNVSGLFAAGDIRSKSKRQIVMACADGATAAMNAYEYLINANVCV